MSDFDLIQENLQKKADLNARLSLLPYDGTPEVKDVKGQKYLYTRKRVGSRVTSTYIDVYSDEITPFTDNLEPFTEEDQKYWDQK